MTFKHHHVNIKIILKNTEIARRATGHLELPDFELHPKKKRSKSPKCKYRYKHLVFLVNEFLITPNLKVKNINAVMIYKKFAYLVNHHIKLAHDLKTEGIQIRARLKTSKHCVIMNFWVRIMCACKCKFSLIEFVPQRSPVLLGPLFKNSLI